jgi:hypothetical protein
MISGFYRRHLCWLYFMAGTLAGFTLAIINGPWWSYVLAGFVLSAPAVLQDRYDRGARILAREVANLESRLQRQSVANSTTESIRADDHGHPAVAFSSSCRRCKASAWAGRTW